MADDLWPNQQTPPIIRGGRLTASLESLLNNTGEVVVDGIGYTAPIAGDYPGQGAITVIQIGSQVTILGPGGYHVPEAD